MHELPEVNWAPRRMLPPPMTMAILHAVLGGLVGLPGDVHDGVHGDAALAGMDEPLAGNLQHHAYGRRAHLRLAAAGLAMRHAFAMAALFLGEFPVDETNDFHAGFLGHLADRRLSSLTNGCSIRQRSA